jgi:hypothetical protein
MYAASSKDIQSAMAIFNNFGAKIDFTALNRDGKTVLGIALQNGNEAIIGLISFQIVKYMLSGLIQ